MKVKLRYIIFPILLLLLAFNTTSFFIDVPASFPKPVYNLKADAFTASKIQLGRVLFYDPILSKNNTISCASCHSSFNAFAHTDHALSHGIFDSIGKRNAPALFNLAWQTNFMWDGAINHIDMQALAPISDKKEMAESLENVIKKLNSSPIYPKLFQKAYGDTTATSQKLLKAIALFQLSILSYRSKYDQVISKKDSFSIQEYNGYKLFKRHCNSCHAEPLFSNYQFANNGLSINKSLNDFGKGAITKQARDSLLFKIPSLRNLSYTYPYMHDGRFNRLSEVINHYTNGIVQHKNSSEELKKPINLSANEKVDLISFLLTLNDKEFVKDTNYQFPKKILLPNEGTQ